MFIGQINTVWEDSLQVYGYRKVWHQLQREGVQVAAVRLPD
jgi:putative transposase